MRHIIQSLYILSDGKGCVIYCLQSMQTPDNKQDQKTNNRQQQIDPNVVKAESEEVTPVAQRFHKQHEDFEIFEPSSKIIKNSSSYKNSLLTKFQPSKAEVLSQKGKSIHAYRNELTYLSEASREFIVYCIVNKQSNSGMFSHQRLLVLQSRTKTLQYFSKIPPLPVRSLEQINEHPKEQINISTAQKFTAIPLRSGIGEIQLSWVQGGKPKKWNIKMGNNLLARDFCIVTDSVRKGKHLQEKIEVSKSPPKQLKINSKKTKFIAQVVKLQEKRSLNQSIVSRIEHSKREEFSQNDIIANQIIEQIQSPIVQQPPPIPQEIIEKQELNRIKLPQTIVRASTGFLNVPTNQLIIKQSIKSIKIEQIINEVNREVPSTNKQQQMNNPPTVVQLPSHYVEPSPRHSDIDRMLKNRRMFGPNENGSISTIKHQNKQHEMLGKSKLLVKNIHRKPTNKQQFQTTQKQRQKAVTPERFYRSQQPQKLNAYRQNLLVQRRLTQLPSSFSKQRKTHILNQHSHPRQEKSRSRSKNKEISESGVLIERDWLLKWVNASNKQTRAQIYSKFVEHCKARVQKLVAGFDNWHMFHKQHQEYVIKQNFVEYTYQMLNSQEQDELSVTHERQMLQKMSNLDYVWKSIHKVNNSYRYLVPLTCIVIHSSLKVYCKVQLASDSLLIEEIHEGTQFKSEIRALQSSLRCSLRYCSLFHITSNETKCIYIHDADILPMLNLQKGLTVSHSFIQDQVSRLKQFQQEQIMQHISEDLIPSFIDSLDQSQIISCKDLQGILEAHHLNYSFMPLICKKALQLPNGHARRLILSEFCAYLLELQVRERVHGFLMKKQSNKSLNTEIYYIIQKALRWKDDESRLKKRVQSQIGIIFTQIEHELIDQYIIGSLLLKISLNCQLKSVPELQKLEQKQFSFWRECEFDQESMALTFTQQTINYDHRFFYDRSDNLIEILSKPPPQLLKTDMQSLRQILKISSLNHASYQYKVLPLSLRLKINNFQQLVRIIGENQFITQINIPKQSHSQEFYYNKECLDFAIFTIGKLIKLRRYQQAVLQIKRQLIRALVWFKSSIFPLIALYDLSSLLNLQRHSQNALADCLTSLRISIDQYGIGRVSESFLMEKTYKAAQIHSIFCKWAQALQFYRACSEIFDKMIEQNQLNHQVLTKYMVIYSIIPAILMAEGRFEQAVTQIRANLSRYAQWKDGLKNARFELMAKVHSEQFENYLLLARCHELMGKRVQILQVAQQMSVKFIENYVSVMIDTGKPLSSSLIPEYRFREIVKLIWYAIVLNCSGKKLTYHQYFSKIYSLLKNIHLSSIRDILCAVKQECKNEMPFPQNEAILKISEVTYARMPTNNLQKLCNYTMDSFLVEICIRCLSALSSPLFLQGDNEQQENSRHLEFLSCLVSLAGYDFMIGAIDACQE